MVLFMTASGAHAEASTDFARFWGAVLAIEDNCPEYVAYTDVVAGSHLDPAEYEFAKLVVEDFRERSSRTVGIIGCKSSAEMAANLGEIAFLDLWEVRP